MYFFLFVFFSIYGGMHAYLYWKVCAAFPHLGKARIALAAFLLLMVLAPVLVRWLEHWRQFTLANVLGFIAYTWLAVVFWFFIFGIAVEFWNLAAGATALAVPRARSVVLPPRIFVYAVSGLIVLGLGWGFVEAASIRVRNLQLAVPNLPASLAPLKLVQITDLHLGVSTGKRRLGRIIQLIKGAEPDLLVSTGDLVDSSFHRLDSYAVLFREIKPPLGKFAVLGNHEFYLGQADSLAFHEAAGFQVLRGESVIIGEGLRLAGVDDPAGRRQSQKCMTDEGVALAGDPKGLTTILLKHQPRVVKASLGHFDLQLSGHTHGGQIFPFHLFVAMTHPYLRGLYKLPGGARLYVSPGAGTWGPPLRVFARPEITLITLLPAE